jgi:hypothetical protein
MKERGCILWEVILYLQAAKLTSTIFGRFVHQLNQFIQLLVFESAHRTISLASLAKILCYSAIEVFGRNYLQVGTPRKNPFELSHCVCSEFRAQSRQIDFYLFPPKLMTVLFVYNSHNFLKTICVFK